MSTLENVTEVIGFDLGHGETALARVRMNDKDNYSQPDPIEVKKKKINVTAVGYHPQRGILIGEPAIVTKGITESHIAFKKRPNSDPVYRRVLQDFITTIHKHLLEQGRIDGDSSFFVVGCPSEWTQEDTTVQSYEQIFSEAGISQVKVISESRAALMHAIESGMFSVSELKSLVLVVDIGSSTTDFTLVDLKGDTKSVPFDIGHDLGASFIEKAIMEWFLERHEQREEVLKVFSDQPYLKNNCELICRKAKEAYFSDPEQYPDESASATGGVENFQGRYDVFMPEVNSILMHEILNTPNIRLGNELKSWPDAFEDELDKLRQLIVDSKGTLPQIILLTGGASRMDFVRESCLKVFPKASIKVDDYPELCIARGLARWGRIEINTNQFSKDIDKFCISNIGPKVASKIDSVYDSIGNSVGTEIIDIIKREFDHWKDRTYDTLDTMQTQIDNAVEAFLKEDNLSQLFREKIRPIVAKIGEDLRDDIKTLEENYKIPIGTLGTSFNLNTPKVGQFSIGSRANVDAMGGITEGLSTAIGWISGILATVVTYFVGSFILGVVAGIILVISTTLGTLILSILLSNPAGWAILASAGIAGVVSGGKARDRAKKYVDDNISTWDLPLWVRKLVNSDSVYSKIDGKRSEIVNEIVSKLKADSDIRQQLTTRITDAFAKSLEEKAKDAKLLIS